MRRHPITCARYVGEGFQATAVHTSASPEPLCAEGSKEGIMSVIKYMNATPTRKKASADRWPGVTKVEGSGVDENKLLWLSYPLFSPTHCKA